jgi:hypothetical protein
MQATQSSGDVVRPAIQRAGCIDVGGSRWKEDEELKMRVHLSLRLRQRMSGQNRVSEEMQDILQQKPNKGCNEGVERNLSRAEVSASA